MAGNGQAGAEPGTWDKVRSRLSAIFRRMAARREEEDIQAEEDRRKREDRRQAGYLTRGNSPGEDGDKPKDPALHHEDDPDNKIGGGGPETFSFKIDRRLLNDPAKRRLLDRKLDELIRKAVKERGYDTVYIYKGNGKDIDPQTTQLVQNRIVFLLSRTGAAGRALGRMGFTAEDTARLNGVTISPAPQHLPPGAIIRRALHNLMPS